MKKPIIKQLDETIAAVKLKENTSEFGENTIDKFETTFVLTLEIIRFEILTEEAISDKVASVASRLFAFQVFEYYMRDYPPLYAQCSALASELRTYNSNWKNFDLPRGPKTKLSWLRFFGSNVRRMTEKMCIYIS